MRKSSFLTALVALFVLLGLSILSVSGVGSYTEKRTVTATVSDKERVCKTAGDCEYLVFTDEGTFKISDSVVAMRWDSSDVYGRIKEGKTYEFKVFGWRVPAFSMYPNIDDLTEVVK